MPRRSLQFIPGEFYHVFNRGANRSIIFRAREDYALFLTKWRQHVTPAQIEVIAYCLMPNHYHLLVRAGDAEFSKTMHRFSTAFVKAWNRLRQRTGVAFEGEFQAVHVDQEEYLLHLSRYIHRNPLVAKLVSVAEDWEFSSYADFIGLRDGTLPHSGQIMKAFADRNDYRRFVEGRCFDDAISHLLIDEKF